MEYGIELKSKEIKNNLDKFSIVYFGDPFCERLIPTKQELKEGYDIVINQNKKFILNTPFVTNIGLQKVLNNIEIISKLNEKNSVVFNDWGVFYEVKKRFPNINLILGRLLTKQRTDPNIKDIITNMQPEEVNGIKTKKVPESLFRLFQNSVVNDSVYQEFLIENKINRVEIEFLVWDMFVKLSKDIHATVYYPYAHVATTRICGLLNLSNNKCTKSCNDVRYIYKTSEQYPYIHINNTTYYNIENIMTEEKLQKYPNIDRIVFNDIEASDRYFINDNRNK